MPVMIALFSLAFLTGTIQNASAAEEETVGELRDVYEASQFRIMDIGPNECMILGYDGAEEYVCIPDTIDGKRVTSIGERAFYAKQTLKSVSCPQIEYIGDEAFMGCFSLRNFSSLSQVRYIGEKAFMFCDLWSLEINFQDGGILKDNAFASNNELTELKITGGSMREVGNYVFLDCGKLKNVNIESWNTYTLGKHFFSCTGMEQLQLPSNLMILDVNCLEYCHKLETVKFPNSLQEVGARCFLDCSALKSLSFPQGLVKIGDNFANLCSSLETIDVPSSVKILPNEGLKYLPSLKAINVASGNSDYLSYEGVLYTADGKELLVYPMNTSHSSPIFRKGVKKIISMKETPFTSITIPNTVKKFSLGGPSKNLKEVIYANPNMQEVNLSDFSDCPNLNRIILPRHLKQLDGPIENVPNLKTVIYYAEKSSTAEFDAFSKLTQSMDLYFYADVYDGMLTSSVPSNVHIHTINNPDVTNVAKASNGGAVITFTVSDLPSGSYYRISRSANSSGSYTVILDKLTGGQGQDPAPNPGQNYYKAEIVLPNNVILEGKTNSFVDMGRISLKKVTNVVSGVHIYWEKPQGFDGTFNVYRSTSEQGSYSLLASTKYTDYIDKSAVSGKTYYYKVAMVSENTVSTLSDPLGSIFVGTPDFTSRANSVNGVNLYWQKIAGASGYAVYRSDSYPEAAKRTWKRIATIKDGSTVKYTDKSAEANKVYYYTVRALAGTNYSTLSGCYGKGRTMVRLESLSMTYTKKKSATSIACGWTKNSAASGYEIRFMVGSAVFKTVVVGNPNTVAKTFYEMKASGTYKIQVRSYVKTSSAGTYYSGWSEPEYFKM